MRKVPVLVCVMSAIAAGQTAARIDVAPREALVDESVAVRISGLAP